MNAEFPYPFCFHITLERFNITLLFYICYGSSVIQKDLDISANSIVNNSNTLT